MLAFTVFGFYFLVIVAGASIAVFSKSLVRALIGLILTLAGVAGMYLLMQAPFLAFMQLLIYAGAVSVLVFFAIMMTQAHAQGEESTPVRGKTAKGLATSAVTLLVLLPAVALHPLPSRDIPEEVPLASMGQMLLQEYSLPFELISVILLVAMLGGVLLAWERRRK